MVRLNPAAQPQSGHNFPDDCSPGFKHSLIEQLPDSQYIRFAVNERIALLAPVENYFRFTYHPFEVDCLRGRP